VCEVGHARSLLVGAWRYVYSPPDVRSRGKSKSDASDPSGVGTRHPGVRSVEQLYDLTADPLEEKELIERHSLLMPVNGLGALPIAGQGSSTDLPPLSPEGERAAEAFAWLRARMQRDLLNVSNVCGV
jgi:hypothetical protein